MTFLIVIVAVLALLSLVSAMVMIPYLCAMATGRVLGWVFQVESEPSALDVNDRLPPDRRAEVEELVASSGRMARKSRCRAERRTRR
ncbi:hypothetical protein [Acidovorax sp. MR-S7]|uniref:hypothetical protein n=1 Tax=Acidovorax sp. MR-S7 TaxID=1268622 RepID=UPI00036607A4|nr:hypothetical protein [Acidovorax sp. MR-S7]GAD22638.1 permeases of the major facilitator superfamily [Acidovorax sp. MR-S7]